MLDESVIIFAFSFAAALMLGICIVAVPPSGLFIPSYCSAMVANGEYFYL